MTMQDKRVARSGWFATITRPGLHLFASAMMFGMIVMGVGLSIAVPAAAAAITVGIALPAAAWWYWMMRVSRSN
ncbi:hypothetical protein ITJ43_00455 [Microbacterium sp. VKM Ac-2870]|uniref:hypothetical protein n=1 Tax=Microbacterium sp. VKM Ac-2870 TaxID=2783825 RepID=UPI00188D973B|nr:hypothetical protein [Microbacterium sp. VKM Ac-2870]MBF4560611.1 hypothetical protein [Microbacterium sp. VKM Ac-2870]